MATPENEARATKSTVSARGSRKAGGYAAVFNSPSHFLGSFREVIENRAFAKAQSDGFPGLVCRYEHSRLALLGSVAAGTLEVRTDATGLEYVVDIPKSMDDVLELVERGEFT